MKKRKAMFRHFIKKSFAGLTKNSVFLAFASFFSDISSEMLYPILPIYLTQNLKAGGSIIGIIEGIAEAVQNIIQGFSGYLSDSCREENRSLLQVTFSLLFQSRL
jgi:hypothetical protein